MSADIAIEHFSKGKGLSGFLKRTIFNGPKEASDFCSKPLDIHPIMSPDEVIWENFAYLPEE